MNLHKQIIDDLELNGKRVIIRADFNVPLDDSRSITDDLAVHRNARRARTGCGRWSTTRSHPPDTDLDTADLGRCTAPCLLHDHRTGSGVLRLHLTADVGARQRARQTG